MSAPVLNAAQTRIDVGAGSDFERASAQLELSRIEASELSALRDQDEQLMALRDVLDLPAESSVELTTRIDVPAELQPLVHYLQEAQKIHPEFVLSQARLRSLDASRERLRAETKALQASACTPAWMPRPSRPVLRRAGRDGRAAVRAAQPGPARGRGARHRERAHPA